MFKTLMAFGSTDGGHAGFPNNYNQPVISMDYVITDPVSLRSTLDSAEDLPLPTSVLMVTPDYYSIDYVINPHMEGHVGGTDPARATWQWEVVRDKFRHFGLQVYQLPGRPGLPDMVFSANQSLPFPPSGGIKPVLMSLMHSEYRRDEVPWFEQWYRQNGYEIHFPDTARISVFEGMGDAIWHPGKRLIWGGYGHRTDGNIYPFIAEKFKTPVVLLELVDPAFYHLDTCFCPLNQHAALIYPHAFTPQGLKLIHAVFPVVLEAPEDEAIKGFACNASCPDGRNVVIQKGCRSVNTQLKSQGLAFHEVDTSEFLKSGGSVFCMKLMLW